MERLERLAGRLAHGFNQLDGESPEGILEAAPLVSQLADELASRRHSAATASLRLPSDTSSDSRAALLVDERPEDRRLVREMLQRLGYTVLEAENGAEALELCARHTGPVHIMLAGVLIENMSGRELAERASCLKPEMSVIYMSGYTEDDIMFCGILGPGIAALQKPITFEALAHKLAEVAEAEYA
jgi:two-component system, cell cycle sensor histidine kinase and response regulator CckA